MFRKILIGACAVAVSISTAFAAVNINTANQAELASLPGVGPAQAKAIIDYRMSHGPFKTIDDIKNVKGFGAKKFDALKSQLTVDGAKTKAAPAKKTAK